MELETKMKTLFEKITANPGNATYTQEYEQVKLEYEILYQYHVKGLIIRSKAQWVEEGERCTKYFMNLEKRNIVRKSIVNLIDNTGNNVTNQEDVIKMQVDYYNKLYKNKGQTEKQSFDKFVDNVNLKTIEQEDKEACEGLLKLAECENALKTMKNDKSPGIDGLTAEFYKCHWKTVGNLIINSFNEAFEAGELSTSHKRGVIILI